MPELGRRKLDALLVVDNLHVHKLKPVRALLDRSGFADRYLPSRSPDLNPIEPGWAKVKSALPRAAAGTVDALCRALGLALGSITTQDATGSFVIAATFVPAGFRFALTPYRCLCHYGARWRGRA